MDNKEYCTLITLTNVIQIHLQYFENKDSVLHMKLKKCLFGCIKPFSDLMLTKQATGCY